MSYTCSDFYETICDHAARAGLVSLSDLPEDESAVAIMSERVCDAIDSAKEMREALRAVLTASEYKRGEIVLDPLDAITTGRPLMEALSAARAALAKVQS